MVWFMYLGISLAVKLFGKACFNKPNGDDNEKPNKAISSKASSIFEWLKAGNSHLGKLT